MRKIFAATLLVLGTQACSNSSPSASDIAKSLRANYQNCPYVAIEHLKLLNGLKIDDLTHQVQVQYDLTMLPLPASKVEEIHKLEEDREAERQKREVDEKELDQQAAELGKQALELGGQIEQEVAARGLQGDNPEYWAEINRLRKERGVEDMQAKSEDLKHQGWLAGNRPFSAVPPSLADEWSGRNRSCFKGFILTRSDGASALQTALTQGLVNTIQATLTMQKTDQGWMLAE